jgi:hypothetical protein
MEKAPYQVWLALEAETMIMVPVFCAQEIHKRLLLIANPVETKGKSLSI